MLAHITRDIPSPGPGEALVAVGASAINPSDVKNVAGLFHSVMPRTPGRDYAGVVVSGDAPDGMEVWGSGPGFGITRDGAHAEYVVAPADGLSMKPACLSMAQAASVGVPFITAWSALVTQGRIQAGETVLIIGAAGAVGRAAAQIAAWKGARAIGAVRAGVGGMLDTAAPDLDAQVRDLTGGLGADLVLDTVGGPLFEPALRSVRVGGRLLAIASGGQPRVSFNLIDFYHNATHLIGVDSLKLTGREIAAIMNALAPGFEAGALRPFDVVTWTLDRAVEAYEAVARGGSPVKQVLVPHDSSGSGC